jgi:translation initiation factor 4E
MSSPTPATPSDKKDKPVSKVVNSIRKESISTALIPESTASPSAPPDFNAPWPLKYTWAVWYRPPTAKNVDYEKSIVPLCKFSTAQEFWKVFSHLKRPSSLPSVSDYHVFKQGIRPVWEDDENKRGGKWIMRLKKGVADRYWEDLLLALVGDQFLDAGDGVKNVKIRDTIRRVLKLPEGTNIVWRSHDDSIAQRSAIDQARHEKSQHEKRRVVSTDESRSTAGS